MTKSMEVTLEKSVKKVVSFFEKKNPPMSYEVYNPSEHPVVAASYGRLDKLVPLDSPLSSTGKMIRKLEKRALTSPDLSDRLAAAMDITGELEAFPMISQGKTYFYRDNSKQGEAAWALTSALVKVAQSQGGVDLLLADSGKLLDRLVTLESKLLPNAAQEKIDLRYIDGDRFPSDERTTNERLGQTITLQILNKSALKSEQLASALQEKRRTLKEKDPSVGAWASSSLENMPAQ